MATPAFTSISQELDDKMVRRLFTVYGDKFDLDLADEMIESLRHSPRQPTEDEYDEAVGRWISRSQWPPKPSDILGLIDEVRSESQREQAAALNRFENETADITNRPSESTTTRSVEVQIGTNGAMQTLTYTVDSFRPKCRDCSDRGIAHFYADKDDPRNVYLSADWEQMTDEQQRTYRHNIAICDCVRGLANPKRDNRTVEWFRGRERSMSVYPLIEIVRQIAKEHRNAEQVPLQVVESGRYGN